MLEKADLLQIKEVVQEVVKTEIDSAKEELRGEMKAMENRLQGEIVAVKEELHEEIVAVKEELHEEIVAVRNDNVSIRMELRAMKKELQTDQAVILDEIERTRTILEGKIIRLDNGMAELTSCYRSDRLEHDTMDMQYSDLEKRVGRLERKMA